MQVSFGEQSVVLIENFVSDIMKVSYIHLLASISLIP